MAPAQQDEQLVRGQFEDQIARWTAKAQAESRMVPFLLDWLEAHPEQLSGVDPLAVCEFGGGGGVLLAQLGRALGERVLLYNAELVENYRAHQASPAIHFLHNSILDSGLPDGRFDVVMMRDVLHHLIGRSWGQSRANQALAIRELFRVVKPGGVVLIQEQVNRYAWACRLIYSLSRLASALRLHIDRFEITPHTVIAYLTRGQLRALLAQHVPAMEWLANEYRRRDVALRWKLTVLMSNNGDAFVAIRKPVGPRL